LKRFIGWLFGLFRSLSPQTEKTIIEAVIEEACMTLSDDDREALRYAKNLLENPSLAAKITNVIGVPIEKDLNCFPRSGPK
jgi:hypothetical protein